MQEGCNVSYLMHRTVDNNVCFCQENNIETMTAELVI